MSVEWKMFNAPNNSLTMDPCEDEHLDNR